ncbi:serine/threonine-protein kinase pim-3-like [Oratosquilla oratoria]|uniref:serine/threonine-protein kinase pim-3-like n=1 Tax=Oratosquilla oratoria TaxID=337810 RepID=UPI003F75C07E
MEFDLETAKVFKRNYPKQGPGTSKDNDQSGAMTTLIDYEVYEPLGQGGFGCVYRAKRVVDGLQVALKQVPLASVKSWGTHQGESVPKEAALLQRVQQVPGVIKIIDSFSSEDSFYMVMELIPSAMSLYDYIETSNQLPIAQVKRLFTKVVKAIQGCIDVGVSHKDIKPENILIYRDDSNRFDIKVIDFGSGELITSYNGKKTGGTPIYWPPEYINGGKFIHVPATVWSLGWARSFITSYAARIPSTVTHPSGGPNRHSPTTSPN